MSERRPIDLLIIDDDSQFRGEMARTFARDGIHVQEAGDGEQALAVSQHRQFDVAICDLLMPGLSGIELIRRFKEAHPESEVIVLTGQGTVETAVQAMKLGVYDFLIKPVPAQELEKLIERAYERHQLRKENVQLKTLLQRTLPKTEMIGRSPAMQEVFRLIERAGPSDKAILIQGESGTGKELVARALHECSKRSERPMVVINCAALPEALLESELFGHEKGSFTGAVSTKAGLFETADGGTMFIDEIGEMPAALQAKLLRVLEDGSMRRVGSLKERRVNVRLLVATNCDLSVQVAEGKFREDLYYRINVMSLELPPLRERVGDIPLLVEHLLGADWSIEEEALRVIERYPWPGNVRQLINAIDRAKILADDHLVRARDLPKEVLRMPTLPRTAEPPRPEVITDDLATLERQKVIEIMRRQRGNKTRAARTLGIDRRKLYRLIEKYQILEQELLDATPRPPETTSAYEARLPVAAPPPFGLAPRGTAPDV